MDLVFWNQLSILFVGKVLEEKVMDFYLPARVPKIRLANKDMNELLSLLQEKSLLKKPEDLKNYINSHDKKFLS